MFEGNVESYMPWAEFNNLGLHWLVNAELLNPRGYHMTMYYPDPEFLVSTGFFIHGDGTSPWEGVDPNHPIARRAFKRVKKFLK
jgi:hypothetical protein